MTLQQSRSFSKENGVNKVTVKHGRISAPMGFAAGVNLNKNAPETMIAPKLNDFSKQGGSVKQHNAYVTADNKFRKNGNRATK